MKKIIFKIINYLSVLVFFLTTSTVVNSQVQYIAHRGASFLAPENTMASAKLAWSQGVDAVELDIYLSKDSKIVVIHDGNTKRTSGQDFKVKETESKILRKLDVGSYKDEKFKGERIPFLTEEIDAIPKGKMLVVELKSYSEVLPELKKIVDKSGKQNQLIFICFDKTAILETKKLFPANRCYWLCGNKEMLKKEIKSIADAGLDGVDLSNSIIDEEVMALAKSLKLDIVAYTVDDPVEAKRLVNLGVKGITTNRPEWLKASE